MIPFDARRSRRRARGIPQAWIAAAAYGAITLVMTWPLARGLSRDVASDLGDSLYYMWAIAWDCTQMLAIMGGDLARIPVFFNANIFHPEPLTLVYSDHMIAQAVQALPLFVTSGNLILCYNLLFLSTFVLSGLGTYLFVRELTGSGRAAFVAGLLFAFAPYRIAQAPQLNLLSVHWAPLALYGLRRYFDARRRLTLAGVAAALVALNLSSGYHLLYVAPFVAAYALWEIAARRAWKDRRLWTDLSATLVVVIAATAPFLVPYYQLQNRLPALRDLTDVSRHSADVYAYLTAPQALRFWGSALRWYPRPEGDLFPGLLPLVLAATGIAAWIARLWPASGGATTSDVSGRRGWVRLARLSLAIGVACLAVVALVIFRRRIGIEIGPVRATANDVTRLLEVAAIAFGLALAMSRAMRSAAGRLACAPEAWAVAALVAAWWLSLGPTPTTLGRPLDLASPFLFLFDHVPGYSGTRVPARFAIVVAFALAVLSGYGLRLLDRPRWGSAVLIACSLGFLAEASAHPFPVNRVSAAGKLATPEARVYPTTERPAVYTAVDRLPPEAVLVEFPIGQPEYDRRAMYYSIGHWRPLLNGYSGYQPEDYDLLVLLLNEITRRPELAREALRQRGVTHALVHEAAYLDGEGDRISESLQRWGATETFRAGRDALFTLPGGS